MNKKETEKIKSLLLKKELLDDTRRIVRHGNSVEIPVKSEGMTHLDASFRIKEQEHPVCRTYYTPFEIIGKKAKRILAKEELQLLPKKWEKIGDVLILKFPKGIKKREKILETYADVLKCKTVLGEGSIVGEKREPVLQHLYGDKNTETIHKENKIKFKLDVSKIMFSSGNIDERIRMATVGNEGEVVVDMFAGIGYFSVPMAVYSKVNVYAIEINPTAYVYLKENVVLNGVKGRVRTIVGDCRKLSPKKIANRIIMGYLHSKNFLPTAMETLSPNGGFIHYHFLCREKDFPSRPFAEIKNSADKEGREVELIFSKKIKSYAPHILHGVVDVKAI